jgi:Ca-activated chloride channel family protein
MRAFALALLVCLASSVSTPALQDSTGTIAGVVMDAAGAVIPGASVHLATSGRQPMTTVSDARGEFRFNWVPVGDYELTVSLTGFATYLARGTVKRNTIERVVAVLRIGSLAETVTVQAGAPVVSRSSSGVVHVPEAAAPRRFNTEAYDRIDDNPFRLVKQDPLSTFSIDVDTASYANVRRFLNDGSLPPPDAVRTEELINYFRFDYPAPASGAPLSVTTEIAACPWNTRHRLALIGLRAKPVADAGARSRNLVFLLDVSGSMQPENKLPLVKSAMRMLVDTLTERDHIAIVVYAGASGLVLPSTSGADKERIHGAIARLQAGGSTNGAEGIQLAYRVAREQFAKEGINRVILATDGDFNVGVTNQGELIRLIETERESGIFLTVLGVGTGNLKDSTMEKLADKGNGNYAYLDSLHEARKVLVAEGGATLETVAKDVKIQVEFNPAQVAAYRLIGYENRLLNKEDFNDDRKDAGEIGAGHTVTALYEIVPAGVKLDLPSVDPLKYQRPAAPAARTSNELMTVKVRYKQPEGGASQLIAIPVVNRVGELSPNIGFAAAVAQFAMTMRRSDHRGSSSYEEAAALARRFRGADAEGYRAEFIKLVDLASALSRQTRR